MPLGLAFEGDILSVDHSQLASLVPAELLDEVLDVISTSIQVNPRALILLYRGTHRGLPCRLSGCCAAPASGCR